MLIWRRAHTILIFALACGLFGATAAAQANGIDPALLAKAEAGDAASEERIGFDYANGEGIPQDFAKAAIWYRKAAEQGLADAQNDLGVIYQKGQGVPKDFAQAAVWYRKAAEQGNVFAELNLGNLYQTYELGPDLPQNNRTAGKH